jgi:hypothetical protein
MLQEERVYGVADVLKARGVPFVFMTGLGREAIPAAYVDVPVLHKPVETEKIASILFAD